MPCILRPYLGHRTTFGSHFTQVFIGNGSFIFVLPVIRMYSKEVILSICSYVTRLFKVVPDAKIGKFCVNLWIKYLLEDLLK